MKSQRPLVDAHQALAEAQSLLSQQSWDIRDSIYIEGEHVCVLFDPYPAAEAGRVNVPVTILALQSRADTVAQTPLVLASSAHALYYGRLNFRGQTLFRSLPMGVYSIDLVPDATPFQDSLTQLPEQARQSLHAASVPMRLLAPAGAGASSSLRTADSSLVVSLQAAPTGDLVVSLASADSAWEGRLAALAWRPAPSAEAVISPWRLLLAVLSRNEETNACSATLALGQVAFPCDLLLPEHPLPDEILSEELAAIVEASLAHAIPARSLQAWRLPFERSTKLPAQIRQIIDAALRSAAEAASPWQLEASALYRLASAVVIRLGAVAASFGRLPAWLTPQLVPAPALRTGELAAGHVELLELPHPDANLVLRLSLGPSPAGLATLVVAVTLANPPGPIQQVKVTLLDADGRLLESASTDEDGLVLYQALEAGAYQVDVHHAAAVWQIPVTVETPPNT